MFEHNRDQFHDELAQIVVVFYVENEVDALY